MFDSKQIDAYNQIKAPDELKSRILGGETKKSARVISVNFRKAALVAACFAVFVAAVLGVSANGRTGVTVNGTPLKSNTVVYVSPDNARTLVAAADAALEITLEIRKGTACTARVGELIVTENGTLINTGETYRAESAQSIVWQVPAPDTQSTYVLSVQTAKEAHTLTLRHDAVHGWVVETAVAPLK